MASIGYVWLMKMINRAVANGETFHAHPEDPEVPDRDYPHPITGIIPLLVVLGLSLLLHESLSKYALLVALLGGVLSIYAINFKYFHNLNRAINEGVLGSLLAIGNTAAVVGFGSVAKLTPAFQSAVEAMTAIPGNELVGAAVAVSVIAGLTGSASGGQAIALPAIAPHYLELGVNPEHLHRVVSISSGALDSLPHNGYVVTTIRAICKDTHAAAYGPVAALTVVIPLIGVSAAIAMFVFFG